jgi:predicted P-loop ATPase
MPEAEFALVVKDVYKYAKGQPGNANPSAIFQVVSTATDEDLGLIKFDMTANKIVRATLNNIVAYLRTVPELKDIFRYNNFTETIEVSPQAPWFSQRGSRSAHLNDEDIVLLKYFLSKTVTVEFPQTIVMEGITVIASRLHYHPVRNWLKTLTWDKTPRLDTWLSVYGGAVDNPYTRAVGAKTLCAAVKRAFDPGCKWDHVLILEGPQGIGKSTMCRILGRLWAGDMNLDPHAKDAVHIMLGKWIIELSEMVALKFSEASALKSFITRQQDTVRLSYARHAKDYPRQSIFIGTVNPAHVGYLNDVTGNRRFWIVNLPKRIDLISFEQAADQIWAEATERYRTEDLYLSGQAELLQGYESLARMPEDPMIRQVSKFISENPTITEVSVLDLIEYVGIPAKHATKNDQSRLAQSLIELKWVKTTKFDNNFLKTVYVRPATEMAILEEL